MVGVANRVATVDEATTSIGVSNHSDVPPQFKSLTLMVAVPVNTGFHKIVPLALFITPAITGVTFHS